MHLTAFCLVAMLTMQAVCSLRVGGVRMASRALCMAVTPAPPKSSTIIPTGAFKVRLPDVFVSKTHFKRALRKLKPIKSDMSIKNFRNQKRKFAATSMDALMKGLTVPISDILKAYKSTMASLHPFEATVAELAISARVSAGSTHLTDILVDLKDLRAETSRVAKDFASRANKAETALEAEELLEEGMATLRALYEDPEGKAVVLADLVDIQKDLRRIPVIELTTPTVVLVGAPNVGKSSIVCKVSTGTPEVNDYPFTTRGVTIGHIVDTERQLRFQVMDTPGLLDRPAEERNEMENLTFASLAHLPTAVIFVIDPSGLSGEKSSLEKQLNVRNNLRARFPRRPWLDVVSKADLDIPQDILDRMPEGYLHVSVESGDNVMLLRTEIEDLMTNLRQMLGQMK